MMNKTRIVPFNADKAKFGAKVITRCGYPVRIKHFNGKIKPYTVVAFVEEDGKERTLSFTELGQHVKCCKSKYDLFIEEEVENDSKNQDETIRKALISYFQYFPYNSLVDSGLNAKDVIAWLERQGEQENLCDKCKKSQPSHSCQDITSLGRCAVEHEQKHSDNKLKLQKGDWNIQDAKPGDILASTNGLDILIFKEIDNSTSFSSYYNIRGRGEYNWTSGNFIPATKEQCDRLFKQIKEEGYEWDSDKKELHEIEKVKTRRMTHQELAWWLRDHPEEHRELKMSVDDPIIDSLYYYDNETNVTVNKDIIIRRNGGEWEEPLITED